MPFFFSFRLESVDDHEDAFSRCGTRAVGVARSHSAYQTRGPCQMARFDAKAAVGLGLVPIGLGLPTFPDGTC